MSNENQNQTNKEEKTMYEVTVSYLEYDTEKETTLEYMKSIKGEYIEITRFKSEEDEVGILIPEEIEGLPVKVINYNAFRKCTNLTTVVLPETITHIYDGAFYDCKNLKTILLPSKLKHIGFQAFTNCISLNHLFIPDSVRFLDPSSLENTGIWNNDENWEDDVLYVGNYLIATKETISGEYHIKNGTTYVCNNAFSLRDDLVKVVFPNTVKFVGHSVFADNANLEEVMLNNEIEEIGIYSFAFLPKLKKIVLPEGLTKIEPHLFDGCESLEFVNIPKNVDYIGTNAFSRTNITEIEIPEAVISIGDEAFRDCLFLRSVKLPYVKYIGRQILKNCELEVLKINSPVTLEYLGTRVKHLVLGERISRIADGAFRGRSDLETVTFTRVTEIWDEDFAYCKNLKAFFNLEKGTIIHSGVFTGSPHLEKYKNKRELCYCVDVE